MEDEGGDSDGESRWPIVDVRATPKGFVNYVSTFTLIFHVRIYLFKTVNQKCKRPNPIFYVW